MTHRIGVDVGGTFTDLVLVDDADGSLKRLKRPSTPGDPSIGTLEGTRRLLSDHAVDPENIAYFGHGTTFATNAMIEQHWSRTALLTTFGFRDVIEIRRQQRPDTYDLSVGKPVQIAPRDLRLGVHERVLYDGTIRDEVNPQEVERLVRNLVARGVDAVAVCLLHAYANATNEERIAEIIGRIAPELVVSLSSHIAPEFREYPRVSSTLVNACLQRSMKRYLTNLSKGVRQIGIPDGPHILQSDGGVVSTETAGDEPIRTLVSGPSAGVIGATAVARLAGERDLVTFDVGGTSTDVCLVLDGMPVLKREREIAGYPVRTAMLDVQSIGAGGGSLASVDAGGFLQVGPESTGAVPGPACYSRGGERPAVTDANLVLGMLSPQGLIGGELQLDRDRAAEAIRRYVAEPLGMSTTAAAWSVLRVVNANMARAIRLITVERGHDPRDFILVAYGGAGPAHALFLASELAFRKVLVPPSPGTLCALGLLLADVEREFSRTKLLRVEPSNLDEAESILASLRARAGAWLATEAQGRPERIERSVDIRYAGQSFELTVPLGDGPLTVESLAEGFYQQHDKTYGYSFRAPIDLVTFRVRGRAVVTPPSLVPCWPPEEAHARPVASRDVHYNADDRPHPTPVYDRAQLRPGFQIAGPAVIEEMDSTTVIPPDWVIAVDEAGVLMATPA